MSDETLHRNILVILEEIKRDRLSRLCRLYEDCCTSPDDRSLEVASSHFSEIRIQLDTLRRVLVEQQSFWYGKWFNEDPKKRHPDLFAEEVSKHGHEFFASRRLTDRQEVTLREIGELYRLVSNLGHMIHGAREMGGLVSKSSDRRKHLSQAVCLGDVEAMRAIAQLRRP